VATGKAGVLRPAPGAWLRSHACTTSTPLHRHFPQGYRLKATASPPLHRPGAARAGSDGELARRSLDDLRRAGLLPVILLLKRRPPCSLLEWTDDGQARRALPREMAKPADLLCSAATPWRLDYGGITFFIKPIFNFDARSPGGGRLKAKHWFWGAVLQNWRLVPRESHRSAIDQFVCAGAAPVCNDGLRPCQSESRARNAGGCSRLACCSVHWALIWCSKHCALLYLGHGGKAHRRDFALPTSWSGCWACA